MFTDLYEKLVAHEEKLSIVGLGYVGMPIAVAFAKKIDVVGFDLNARKIELYKSGIDPTHEVGDEEISKTTVEFTADETKLREAQFHIVAVPTPVNDDHTPDLSPVEGASTILGRNLSKGSVVVFESTVYPGVTEDLCIPILENESNLKCIDDFKVGYSPERINPGDKKNKVENITKIVSGIDDEALDVISKVYDNVLNNGVYEADSIKIAEAAKIVENITRDVNIALVNEFAMIFDKMGINTVDVIEAAGTKWNFQKYYPGLVGGHCIGIDPYYLLYKSKKLNFNPKLIEVSREINENLSDFIIKNIIYQMIENDVVVKKSKVLVLGITFKENCNDIRNSKIINVINELDKLGIDITVSDYFADEKKKKKIYGIDLKNDYDGQYDAVIIEVAHDRYKEITYEQLVNLSKNKPIVIDLKSILSEDIRKNENISYWSL